MDENENKPIYSLIFACLIDELKEFARKRCDDNAKFETKSIQFYDEGREIIRAISCINGQSITGKLLALGRLAANKKAANLFITESIQPLSLIIKNGQELEKKFAIRILIQICFHGNNSSSIILNDKNLYRVSSASL